MAQKLRPYQIAADAGVRAAFRRGAKRVLLVMPTGCHAKDQGILMYDGSIKMVQDIRVGDLVMGWDSTARRVTDLHRGRDEMFRVSPVKGRPFVVNRGHVLSLMTTGDKSMKKGAVVDVTVSEWLTWSKYKKHTHKLFRASANFPEHSLPITIDPYFLGVLIGDGSLINRVSVCKPDPEIRAEVDRQAAAHGLECKFYANPRESSSSQVISAKAGSGENYFMRELFRLGLMNKRSGEKFIPPQYKMGSRDTRLSVLAGLIDTDGHLSNGSYDYISKSEMLADDVCFVARSLGLAAYKKVCTKSCQGGFSGTYYRVSISGDCSIIPCSIPRKVAGKRRQIKNHLVSGFSVESVGVGDYYGFTIEGDGRYLMDDFTVTHNSGKTTTFAHWLMGAVAKGSSVIFLAHRRELISQASQRLTQHGVPHAVIQAGSRYEPNAQVQVASVQSLIPKLFPADPETAPDRPRADVLVFDEAHRSTSESYRKIIGCYPHAYVIGLSVGPDSMVLIDNGSSTLYTRIDEMWDMFIGLQEDIYGWKYPRGVMVRAFDGKDFVWKPLRGIFRHRLSEKRAYRIKCEKGAELTITEDHSVYIVDRSEADGRGARAKPIGRLVEALGKDLRVGDHVLMECSSSRIRDVDEIDVTKFLSKVEYIVRGEFQEWINKNVRVENGYKKAWQVRYNQKNGKHGCYLNKAQYAQCGGSGTIAFPGNGNSCKTHIPVSAIAYLLGFYVGDGWVDGGRVNFAVENSMVDKIISKIEALSEYAELSIDTRQMAGASVEVRVCSLILAKVFSGLCPGRAWEKKIPDECFGFSEENLRLFIDGMMDSDGHLSERKGGKRQYHYVTTSHKLAMGLREVLKMVGVCAGISATPPKRGGVVRGRQINGKRTRYSVYFSAHALEGRSHGRFGQRRRFSKRTPFSGLPVKIKSIEEVRPEYVYDLSVDDDGWQTFVANGILVHNTATPARTDGRGLGDVYDALVEVTDVADLIEQGYLCDYRIFEGKYEAPDEGLKITAEGEFDEDEAAKRIDTDKLVGDVYANWKKYADGKRTIIFAQSRKHAKHILEVFLAAGEKFVYVDGTTKNSERDKAGEDLAAGRITGIVNVQVYVEGFDVPLLECVVLAFMTASIIKYRQAVGRALRPAPGKPYAIILDHGGNARHRFGGPDAPHEWSLDGRKKRETPAQPSLTTCPQCLAIVTSRMRICPDCEYVLAARAPKPQIPDTMDGMLVEGNYKIRGSEREERRKAKLAALLEKERRAAEREAARAARAAAEAAKLARIEEGKKFLREAIALAQRKGYNFKYPLMKLKERFGSGMKNFQWNQYGVSVKRERQWVVNHEKLGGGEFRHVIVSFEFEGVVYGAQTAA